MILSEKTVAVLAKTTECTLYSRLMIQAKNDSETGDAIVIIGGSPFETENKKQWYAVKEVAEGGLIPVGKGEKEMSGTFAEIYKVVDRYTDRDFRDHQFWITEKEVKKSSGKKS